MSTSHAKRPKATKRHKPSKEVPAGEFKTHCLALMDRVREHRAEYIITKHGRPVAKLVPIDDEPPDVSGCMKGTVRAWGDLVSSTGEVWDADAGDH